MAYAALARMFAGGGNMSRSLGSLFGQGGKQAAKDIGKDAATSSIEKNSKALTDNNKKLDENKNLTKETGSASGQLTGIIEKVVVQFEKYLGVLNQISAPLMNVYNQMRSMTFAGLSGTVELNRYNRAWTMLNREMAAVFLPVINTVTKALFAIRDAWRSLGKEGQNAMLVLGASLGAISLLLTGLGIALAGLAATLALLASGLAFIGPAILAMTAAVGAAIAISPELRASFLFLWEELKALFIELTPIAKLFIIVLVGGLKIVAFTLRIVVDLVGLTIRTIRNLIDLMGKLMSFIPGLNAIGPGINKIIDGFVMPTFQMPEFGDDRRSPTLAQTGTEGSRQTFQRMQSAVLQLLTEKTESPDQKLAREQRDILIQIRDALTPNDVASPTDGSTASSELSTFDKFKIFFNQILD